MPLSKTQRELLKKKNKLWKKQKSNNSQDRKEYNKIRNKVKSMIRKARREYEAEIASKAKSDPKVVWSYIKSKTRVVQGVPDLYINNTKGDDLTKIDSEKAQILSDFFASVYVSESSDDVLPHVNDKLLNHELPELTLTESMIAKKLGELDINKSCGPDQMHPHLLKEMANE